MSKPAPKSKGEFFLVPNSLIDNQFLLTRAELALAMAVLRRSNSVGGAAVSMSDVNWQNWTGLSARQKEYAAAGLAKKGLWFEGRGEKTRYAWQEDLWEAYVRQTEHERPKTEGRKANPVPAKKNAMVHPDCANNCAMLQQDPNAQPMAPAKLVLLPAGKIEKAWPATLEQLREYFPLVDVPFLSRLLSVVKASIGTVTDAELAHAVTIAYKRHQRSEGLFLDTVPEALAAIRRVKAKPVPAAAGGVDPAAIERRIGDVLAVLSRDTWAPGDLLADLARLRERVIDGVPEVRELEKIDDEMSALEKRIIEAAHVSLDEPQRAKIRQRVAGQVKPYAGKMSAPQLDELARTMLERELLQYFAVPRLGVFYV